MVAMIERNMDGYINEQLRVRSPAKLILSGEHAVLYGQPALAIAVNYYTEAVINWHKSQVVHFKFLDLEYAKEHTLFALDKLKKRVQKNYRAFLQGKCGIKDVLRKPFELLQYSVCNLIEKLNLQLTQGIEIQINSNIPIGCGMGSSAAAIVSTMHAISCLFNLTLETKNFLSISRDIESLQHGKSSGLDLHLTMFGGGVRFCQGETEPRNITDTSYLYAVNTGAPKASTGESVTQVAKHFNSSALGDDFGAVTNALDLALMQNDLSAIKIAINENNKLLSKIGVVPAKVAQFIAAIQKQSGAAKICGAGSVSGEAAGIVLVVSEHDMAEVAHSFNYAMHPIQVDTHVGLRLYSASAPGNLMLLGEHAVLRENQAIVCALDKRITVKLYPQPDLTLLIRSSEFAEYTSSITAIKIEAPYAYVLASVLSFQSQLKTGCVLEITADFSANIGFGSSAAVTVATVAVLAQWLELAFSLPDVFQRAKEIMLQVQGAGSGADIAASVYGGVLHYVREPFMVTALPLIDNLTAVYSGAKLPTKQVLPMVAAATAELPEIYADIFRGISACVSAGRVAIEHKEWETLGKIFSIQHGLMAALGVSSQILDTLVWQLKQLGAFGAKISGSGLGDCVLAIGSIQADCFPQDSSQAALGVKQLPIKLSAQGLQYG